MPYFSKGSLANLIQEKPLSLKEVIKIAQGVLNGLHHIHLKGYLHLDIKPSNIFFTDVGQPMIADFGQSELLDQNGIVDCPQMYLQTLPPESFPPNGIATLYSDIYLMGVTLYRAVNGDRVFNSQKLSIYCEDDITLLQEKIEKGELPNQKYFMPHVPNKIRKIIKKALHTEPTKRFQSAINLAKALSKVEILHDWHTQVFENGEMIWKASQGKGKPELVVELKNDTEDLWKVEVCTDQQGQRRRKRNHCHNGLTRSEAEARLEQIFATLG